MAWRAKQARSLARALWVWAREGLAAWREGMRAAALYAELSRLSDARLARRGLARGDLHRIALEGAESSEGL